jgi:hypothetical protein
VPSNLDSDDVVVIGNRVASVSASYADELVKELLQERRARAIVLVGASEHLTERLRNAAARRHVEDRLRASSAVDAGV